VSSVVMTKRRARNVCSSCETVSGMGVYLWRRAVRVAERGAGAYIEPLPDWKRGDGTSRFLDRTGGRR
jgi:hypothetical protein